MRNYLFIAVTILFFSYCKVPVATITSKQVPVQSNGFVFENDSVKITYNFWGNLGAMTFEVFNKLDQSIYVDLKNSAFIPNDNMLSYWRDEINTESTGVYGYVGYGVNASKGISKSIRRERVIVIPPHSKVTKATYTLIAFKEDINKTLEFRNYLAISNNEKFEGKVNYIDNDFYVSKVTLMPPKQARSATSPMKFYAAKSDLGTHAYFSFKQ